MIFALHAGEQEVAQSAIVGSLFANALLVLGRRRDRRRAARRATGSCASTRGRPATPRRCCWSAPSSSCWSASRCPRTTSAPHHVKAISGIAAVLLLAVYLAWVIPYVRRDQAAPAASAAARVSLAAALVLLVGAGVGSAFVSDWFIDALRPAIGQLGISQAFAGLVIVAIAGNAVEQVDRDRARGAPPQRAGDRGRRQLGRPDRGLPVPGAGADLADHAHFADLRAASHIHSGRSRPQRSWSGRSPTTARATPTREWHWSRRIWYWR